MRPTLFAACLILAGLLASPAQADGPAGGCSRVRSVLVVRAHSDVGGVRGFVFTGRLRERACGLLGRVRGVVRGAIVEFAVRWSVAMDGGVAFHHGEGGYPSALFHTRQAARDFCRKLNAKDKHSHWTPRRVRMTIEECND